MLSFKICLVLLIVMLLVIFNIINILQLPVAHLAVMKMSTDVVVRDAVYQRSGFVMVRETVAVLTMKRIVVC